MLGQCSIPFDRPDARATFENCACEGAEAGPDFNYGALRAEFGEFDRLPHDVAIDEEVLSQFFIGKVL